MKKDFKSIAFLAVFTMIVGCAFYCIGFYDSPVFTLLVGLTMLAVYHAGLYNRGIIEDNTIASQKEIIERDKCRPYPPTGQSSHCPEWSRCVPWWKTLQFQMCGVAALNTNPLRNFLALGIVVHCHIHWKELPINTINQLCFLSNSACKIWINHNSKCFWGFARLCRLP